METNTVSILDDAGDLRVTIAKVFRELAQLKTRLDKVEDGLPEDSESDLTSKSHMIRIIVPSTSHVNAEGSIEEFEARRHLVIGFLVGLFGGATASNPSHGAYRAEDGSLVTEQVVGVTSFCTPAEFEEHSVAVVLKVGKLCREWGQECIGLEMDGVLSYIEPSQAPGRRMSLVPISSRSSLFEMHTLAHPNRSSTASQRLSVMNMMVNNQFQL